MVALASIRRALHFPQKGIHFIGIEPPSRSHRAMAGNPRGNCLKPVTDQRRRLPFRQFIGKISEKQRAVDLAEKGGCLPDGDRARAEAIDDKPDLSEFRRAGHDVLNIFLRQVDNIGNEQNLPCDTVLLKVFLQALIDKALMRRVLINQNKPFGVLGNDVIGVNLRPRRAEGMIGKGDCGCGIVNPR